MQHAVRNALKSTGEFLVEYFHAKAELTGIVNNRTEVALEFRPPRAASWLPTSTSAKSLPLACTRPPLQYSLGDHTLSPLLSNRLGCLTAGGKCDLKSRFTERSVTPPTHNFGMPQLTKTFTFSKTGWDLYSNKDLLTSFLDDGFFFFLMDHGNKVRTGRKKSPRYNLEKSQVLKHC